MALAAVAVSSLALSAALVAAPAQGSSALYGTTGSSPNAIAIDSAGNIYTSNGGSISKLIPGGTSAGGNWPVVTAGGPRGIAIDSADNIYVTLNGSNAIMKLFAERNICWRKLAGLDWSGNWPARDRN